MIEAHESFPEFALPDSEGRIRTLSEFAGSYIVLYAYPRDNTPGCTKEACGFRDTHDQFIQRGCIVIGISADSPASHKRFAERQGLGFILLSDEQKTLLTPIGAWQQKHSYGKSYMGIVRMTWIIGPDGKVLKVFPKVSPVTHAQQVLDYLDSL